jgi:WD repeat-containing protein 61
MIVNKLHEFTGHTACIYTAAINYPLQLLYTAGGDGIVAAWDCIKGGDGAIQVKVGAAIFSMCLCKNKLVLGSNKGNMYIMDMESKTEERNIEAHTQAIFDIVYDEENQRVLTCGFDGVLHVWTEDFKLLSTTKLSDKSLRNICLLPNSIAVASSDFSIYLLDKVTFKITGKMEQHHNSVFAMAYNPLKQELLTGGRDCYLKIWDTGTLQLKQEYVGATLHINHISFNPGYTLYAISSMDKTIKIFDAHTHEPLKFINKEKNDGHTSSVNKTLWLNRNTLLSVSDDKKAMCWSLD